MPFWKRPRQAPKAPPPAERKETSFGVDRDIGKVRNTNQDHMFAMLTSLPGPADPLMLGLFVVADGMGGHTGGAVASARAVEAVADRVVQDLLLPVLRGDQPEAIQHMLREAVLTANRRILEEAVLQGSDMGTTVTAALVLGERLHVAHVGDSRVYTYGAEGLQCRTRDHSMVARLQELGQITAEEARHHPKRNYLYQSVGQQKEIEVEVASHSLRGCSHLLVCSDGLWGSVEDEVLAQALGGGGDPQQLCEGLVAQANAAGGEDNITVIVVAFPTWLAVP